MRAQAEIVVPAASRRALKRALPVGVSVSLASSRAYDARRLVVLDSATALADAEALAPGLRKASRVALLMRAGGGAESATMMVAALRRRMTSSPFVTHSIDVLRRVIVANARGASDRLIASAEVVSGKLLVWSCEPRLYECSVAAVPALAALPEKSLTRFTVSSSGSRLHWADRDIDLDLDTIRYHADPAFRASADKEARRRAQRYGRGIRALREQRGIRQSEIAGLTDREVRRLEAGETQPHSATLGKLAFAHHMSVDEYLAAVANIDSATRRHRQSIPHAV